MDRSPVPSRRGPNHEFALSVLRQTRVFASIGDAALTHLLSMATTQRYGKDEFLFIEGDVLNAYHVILRGKIRACKQSPSGKQLTIMLLHATDTFGDVALVDSEPLCVSLQATVESWVTAIPRNTILPYIRQNPLVSWEIAATIGRRFKLIQERLLDSITAEVSVRIMRALETSYQHYGMVLPLTRQEIADLAGTTRESATKVLCQLQASGVIRSVRGGVVLSDEHTLLRWQRSNGHGAPCYSDHAS